MQSLYQTQVRIRASWQSSNMLVHIHIMEHEKCIDFSRRSERARWRIVDIPRGSIYMDTIQ